jgi:hypothetical protein
MNKKFNGIIACIILLLPALSFNVVSNEQISNINECNENEQVSFYFFGKDGEKISYKKEISILEAEELKNQLELASKAFVTMHSKEASEKEKSDAEHIVDETLTMLSYMDIIPQELSIQDIKEELQLQINNAKRLTILGVIGSAGVGLLRPIHPSILPKVIIFWTYGFGATFSLGLSLIKAKIGPQIGFSLFFIGIVLSIGIMGAFFGFTPFAFFI